MTVTMMPKAPVQPYFLGARLRTPCWMKSKSSTSEYAAMMMTRTPMIEAERDAEDLGAEEAPRVVVHAGPA